MTAVEWLEEQMKDDRFLASFEDEFKQAKEMEKQQIINFANDFIEKHTFGDYDGNVQKNKTVDEYYNETFNNYKK
jgi:hypothetical protein